MEKRSRTPKLSAAGAPEGGKRRQGLPDNDSTKGKRTQPNYEALGMAPMEEEYFNESVKAKLLAFKANRAKIRFANTYRLESHNKFRDYLVRDKAQAILTNRLQQDKYDGVASPSLCASISEEILKAVKELDFDRYKYVVSVLIVEKAGQAMNLVEPDETIPGFSGTMFEALSASAMKLICEGSLSTDCPGAVSQYAASEVVLWLKSCCQQMGLGCSERLLGFS